MGKPTVQERFSFALSFSEKLDILYFTSGCCSYFILPIVPFRLTISLAAQGLMGKRMDLQQQPHSLIEYGNNVTPHLH